MSTKISIIVPIYNAAKDIEQCLKSILSQSIPENEYEIILIDDCSTDQSLEIIKKYQKENKQIKVIEKENNSGVSNSRNLGISKAIGEYITFVDADDYLEPMFLKNMLLIAEQGDYDIVYSGVNLVYEDSKKSLSKLELKEEIEFDKEEIILIIKAILMNDDKYGNPSLLGYATGKLYNRKTLNSILFDSKIRFREDTIFVIQGLLNSKKIYMSKIVGYNYKINQNSASFRFFKNYNDEVKHMCQKLDSIMSQYNMTEQVNVFKLYMYMALLKHYIMHNKLLLEEPNLKRGDLIRQTMKDSFWIDCFSSVKYSNIPMKYKILVYMYRHKWIIGIETIYELNNIRRL